MFLLDRIDFRFAHLLSANALAVDTVGYRIAIHINPVSRQNKPRQSGPIF